MATFIVHVVTYSIISVVPTLIATATMDETNTINKPEFIREYYLLLYVHAGPENIWPVTVLRAVLRIKNKIIREVQPYKLYVAILP